jgi:hypothetical protein
MSLKEERRFCKNAATVPNGIYLLRSNRGARNEANDFCAVSTEKTSRRDPENSVANPDPDQSDKLDPDPHQFGDDEPKCMEHEPICALFQGFEPLFES